MKNGIYDGLHVSQMREIRNTYRISELKALGKLTQERRKRVVNVKIDFRSYRDVKWSKVA